MKKKADSLTQADQSQVNNNTTDNSHQAQRIRLLTALSQSSVTTLQAREDLNILSPAARVFELKKKGHKIIMTWTFQRDAFGRNHKIGRYTLMPGEGGTNDAT